ncbi:hypothetical protein T310_9470, partial [Rasamsonia emersonii CBS 393.64]
QITKACESTMIQAAITKKQYQDLFAAHEKEKQKKKIHHEGGITREEAQDLMRSRDQVVEPPVNDPPQSQLPASQPRQRDAFGGGVRLSVRLLLVRQATMASICKPPIKGYKGCHN